MNSVQSFCVVYSVTDSTDDFSQATPLRHPNGQLWMTTQLEYAVTAVQVLVLSGFVASAAVWQMGVQDISGRVYFEAR